MLRISRFTYLTCSFLKQYDVNHKYIALMETNLYFCSLFRLKAALL